MFTAVRFRNFRSLKDFSVRLKKINVLVGPNNAGKSTILDAFRALTIGLNFASRRNPTSIHVGNSVYFGYELPVTQFPITLTNIHSDYRTDRETSATFTVDNGNTLRLLFIKNSRCILTTRALGEPVFNSTEFRRDFPESIWSFPTLGPLEEEEPYLSDDYVHRWQYSRRAHRMFRNIWHRRQYEFEDFKSLVEKTWPGMTVSPPERSGYPAILTMFCSEGRIDESSHGQALGFKYGCSF